MKRDKVVSRSSPQAGACCLILKPCLRHSGSDRPWPSVPSRPQALSRWGWSMPKQHNFSSERPGDLPRQVAGGLTRDLLLVDAKQARVMLGNISARKLWQMTAEFELPCVRMGRRVMYSPEALTKWILDNTEGGQK